MYMPFLVSAYIVTLFAGLVIPAFAQASEEKVEAPPLPTPLQIRLPAHTKAEVTITRTRPLSDAETADALRRDWYPDLQKMTCLRDDRNFEVNYEWEGGKKTSAYLWNGRLIFSASVRIPEDIRTGGVGAPDWSKSDFPEAGWIRAEDYAGKQILSGRVCYVFDRQKNARTPEQRRASIERELRELGVTDPRAFAQMRDNMLAAPAAVGRVWLDAKTLLPLQVENEAFRFRYTYSSVPEIKVSPEGIYRKFVETPPQPTPGSSE